MIEFIQVLKALKAVEYGAGKLSEILDKMGPNFDKHVYERIKYLAHLQETNVKSIKEGLLDDLLTEYYKNTANADYILYESAFKKSNKCAFAYKNGWIGNCLDLTAENIFQYDGECEISPDFEISTYKKVIEKIAAEEFGIEFWDAPIYTLKKINQDKKNINFRLGLSRYFKHKFAFGRIQEENLSALQENDDNGKFKRTINKDEIQKILNNRTSIMGIRSSKSGLPNLKTLRNFNNRIIPTGVNVLFAMRRGKQWGDDYALIAQKRAFTVAEGPGTLTVVPTGIHQPMVDPIKEVDIVSTIWREIYEELFQGEEAKQSTTHLVPEWYRKQSEIISDMSRPGASRVLLTAFGFNLHIYFFDFCILVVVNDSVYWEKNWHTIRGNWEQDSAVSPVISSKDREQIQKHLLKKEWSPSSRVAFEQGLIALSKQDQSRIDLPNYVDNK